MRGEIAQITQNLIEAWRGRPRIDIVDDFAYPLPVTAICRLLGVPREDQPRFQHDCRAGQRLGDRAAGLGLGGDLLELGVVDAGHLALRVQLDPGDPEAARNRVQVDFGGGRIFLLRAIVAFLR